MAFIFWLKKITHSKKQKMKTFIHVTLEGYFRGLFKATIVSETIDSILSNYIPVNELEYY